MRNPVLIAETAYSHEGDKNYLWNLLEKIDSSTIDAVKFHMLLNLDSYIVRSHSLYSRIKKWIFDEQFWKEILEYLKKKGFKTVVLTDDVDSVKFVKSNIELVDYINLHSTSIWDVHLLKAVRELLKGSKLILIFGIGGLSIDEINFVVNFFEKDRLILSYGFQTYPTDYKYINLLKIIKLMQIFNVPILYADHTSWDDSFGLIIPLIAFALGADYIEKHIVLEKGKKRVDYESALEPNDLNKLKQMLIAISIALGNGDLILSEPEEAYASNRKQPVALNNIPEGYPIGLDNVNFKRIENENIVHMPTDVLVDILDQLRAYRDISKDEPIKFFFY